MKPRLHLPATCLALALALAAGAGVPVCFQVALVDAAPTGLRIGLTTGLYEVLGL